LLAPLPSDAKPDNVDLVPATTAPATTLPQHRATRRPVPTSWPRQTKRALSPPTSTR
jgi:hypothetical protein